MDGVRRLRSQTTSQPASISTGAFYSSNPIINNIVRRQTRRSMPLTQPSAMASGDANPAAKSRTPTPAIDTSSRRRSLRSQSTTGPRAAASLSPTIEPRPVSPAPAERQDVLGSESTPELLAAAFPSPIEERRTPSSAPTDRRRSLRSQSVARPAASTPTPSIPELSQDKKEETEAAKANRETNRENHAKRRAQSAPPKKRKKRRSENFGTRKKPKCSIPKETTADREENTGHEEQLEGNDENQSCTPRSSSLVQSDLPADIVEEFNSSHRYASEGEYEDSAGDDEAGKMEMEDDEEVGVNKVDDFVQHGDENADDQEDENIEQQEEKEGNDEGQADNHIEQQDDAEVDMEDIQDTPDRNATLPDLDITEEKEKEDNEDEGQTPPQALEADNKPPEASCGEVDLNTQDAQTDTKDNEGDDSLAEVSFTRRRPHRQRKPTKFFDESYVATNPSTPRRTSASSSSHTPTNSISNIQDMPPEDASSSTTNNPKRTSLIVTLKAGKTRLNQPAKLVFKVTAPPHWRTSKAGRATSYTATECKALFKFGQDGWDALRESARKFFLENQRLLEGPGDDLVRELNDNEGLISRGSWAASVFPHFGTTNGKENGGEFLLFHAFRYMRRMVKKNPIKQIIGSSRDDKRLDFTIKDHNLQVTSEEVESKDQEDTVQSDVDNDNLSGTQMEIPDSQWDQNNDLSSLIQGSGAQRSSEDPEDSNVGPSLASIQLTARISDLMNEVSELRDLYDTERGSRLSLKAEFTAERERRVTLESQLSAERDANRQREEQFTQSLQDLQSSFTNQLTQVSDKQMEANRLLAFRLRNVHEELSEELQMEKQKRVEAEQKLYEMIEGREYLGGNSRQQMLDSVNQAMQGLEAIKGILSPGALGKRTRDGELITPSSAALEGSQMRLSSGLNGTDRLRLTNGFTQADVAMEDDERTLVMEREETAMIVRGDDRMMQPDHRASQPSYSQTPSTNTNRGNLAEGERLSIHQNRTSIPSLRAHSPRSPLSYPPTVGRRVPPVDNTPTHAQAAIARILKEKKRVSFREEPEVQLIESNTPSSNRTKSASVPPANGCSTLARNTARPPQVSQAEELIGLKALLPREYHRHYSADADIRMEKRRPVRSEDFDISMKNSEESHRRNTPSDIDGESTEEEEEYVRGLGPKDRDPSDLSDEVGAYNNGINQSGRMVTNGRAKSPIIEEARNNSNLSTTSTNGIANINGATSRIKAPSVGISTGTIVAPTSGTHVQDKPGLIVYEVNAQKHFKKAFDTAKQTATASPEKQISKFPDVIPTASAAENSLPTNGTSQTSNLISNGTTKPTPSVLFTGSPPVNVTTISTQNIVPSTTPEDPSNLNNINKAIHTGNFFKITAASELNNQDDDEDFRDIYEMRENSRY